jgi:predicted CXXCH cytochrome family protein
VIEKLTARVGLMAAALLLAVPAAIAGSILGSAHDFTANNWSGGEVCLTCHNPSMGGGTAGVASQWNHTLSSQTYPLYSSPTLKSTVGQPGVGSKLCLSCHDGTVALDSFGGLTGSQFISAKNNIGTTLKDDHPIGLLYNTALAVQNGTLFDPSTKSVTIGSGGTLKTGTVDSIMLFSGQLECSSCHDVHNKFTADTTGLIKVSTTGSAICAACHNK